MMKQMVLLGCMCASFVLSAADGGKEAENLNRLPGTKLSADSVFYKYTADKAADGDRTDKLSRWVSSAESGEHWIMAEYDAPRKVNAVTLVFWTDTHVSLDFDIEGRVDGKWVTLREVRGQPGGGAAAGVSGAGGFGAPGRLPQTDPGFDGAALRVFRRMCAACARAVDEPDPRQRLSGRG